MDTGAAQGMEKKPILMPALMSKAAQRSILANVPRPIKSTSNQRARTAKLSLTQYWTENFTSYPEFTD